MSGDAARPPLWLAYYGDDFTGSTDAMEALTTAGVPTLLCLEPPTPELLQRFPDVRCVGLAGSSRGRSPAWMEDELPAAFASLAGLGAPILHYKVCSTFDSSPEIGSIGRAIDIGVRQMGGNWSPIIVGAPRLRRYQAFGNLFAAGGEACHRLDRHPTMSRHPVTPMHEADLRLHLREQTSRRIELIDLVQLRSGGGAEMAHRLTGHDVPVVFLDVVDEATLLEAGRLVWERRGSGTFSASSSGLSYALASYWRSQGLLPANAGLAPAAPAGPIVAVSGSCSPVTATQIAWARDNGFATERMDIAAILHGRRRAAEIDRCAAVARDALATGRSVIVFSAEGPEDPAVTGFAIIAANAGIDRSTAARSVGTALASVMRQLLDSTRLQRVVVAGGDSSGEVASALGIRALTVQAAMAPGAPLCRVCSDVPGRDGLEIVLKGGQMGSASFFGAVRDGTRQAAA